MSKKNRILLGLLALVAIAAVPDSAFAASAGMPWETPLNQLLNSLTGPVARVLGAMAIIAAGIGVAFSEGGGGIRKVLWVVLGLSITFAAVSWGLPFLGFGGGLAI